MKALPKPGDWVTCKSRTARWVKYHSNAEIGKSYQVTEVRNSNTEYVDFSAAGLCWNKAHNYAEGIYVEFDDFYWETEFEYEMYKRLEEHERLEGR